MDTRTTREKLCSAQAELQRLRVTRTLSGPLKHDLCNALMIVIAFRELLLGASDPELLADAESALVRTGQVIGALG